MLNFLNAPPAKPRLEEAAIDETYGRLRWQVFIGIFVGYAGYYLVRKPFTMAMPDLLALGYTKTELGLALAGIPIAYGLSKFIMGNVSDRSDARKFMSLGLLLSGVAMLVMGWLPVATSSVAIMFFILLLNGWFQGMGWPPSGRVMVHWFSFRERGTKMSFWNIAHNLGGGLMPGLAIAGFTFFGMWQAKLFFPGIVAIAIAFIIYFLIRDRPSAFGLPPIEEYKKDNESIYSKEELDAVISAKEIFVKYIFKNKLLWYIAIANAFVYLVRYGVLDWAPTYLTEVKQFSAEETGWAYFVYEWAGIPGTLLAGYLSDRWFKGKRAPVSVGYMILVLVFVLIYWKNPPGYPMIDSLALIGIGFLIYGPVMLIGVHALDLAPKKAAGTAAGFTGLFGYLGGALVASAGMGIISDNFGWDGGFIALIISCIMATILLSYVWYLEQKKTTNLDKGLA